MFSWHLVCSASWFILKECSCIVFSDLPYIFLILIPKSFINIIIILFHCCGNGICARYTFYQESAICMGHCNAYRIYYQLPRLFSSLSQPYCDAPLFWIFFNLLVYSLWEPDFLPLCFLFLYPISFYVCIVQL